MDALLKTTRLIVLVAVAAVTFGSATVRADGRRNLALLPPTGDNIAPAILQASRELIKDHLLRTGVYNVVEPPPTDGPLAVEPTPAQAAEQARALGAEQAVVVRLTHIGSTARVRLTAYDAGTAQVAYWDSILVTGGPEELDLAFQRLAHAMQTNRPVRDSAEIDSVTDKEMQTLNRRTANKSFGLHLMTFLPFNTAAGSFAAVPGGGLFWLYDARSWMADVSLDLGGQTNRAFFSAGIGGYYPFLREDFTPYLGGVVRWAYMDFGGNGASGIVFQPTVGILLGRLSSVQLRADVGYFFNTFGESPVVGPGQALAVAPTKHYSNGLAVTVGLGF